MKILTEQFLLGKSLYDWTISLAIVIGVYLVSKLVYFLSRKVFSKIAKKTETRVDDIILEVSETPFILLISLAGIGYAINRLHLESDNIQHFYLAINFLIIINLTWWFARFFKALISSYVVPLAQRDDNKLDSHVAKVFQKIVCVVIWCVGILLALHSLGINVKTFLAGLGIGGVAVALAAQDTLKNLIGGITMFVDKPFRIGDRVVINGIDGYVKDIGLRSIRIQKLDGRVVTIPNYKLMDSDLENISSEPTRKIELKLGVVYSTTPELMEKAIDILKTMPNRVEGIENNVSAVFLNYQDSALEINFIYYIKKSYDVFQVQNDVNFDILRNYNANKIDFAFPTQTIFIEK